MVVTRLHFLGSVRFTMLNINIILSVGGHDGPLVRKSVESYNPDNNRFLTFSPVCQTLYWQEILLFYLLKI